MSAAAPNPNKLMLLAAIGIGVYWFMSRRTAAAAPVAVSPTSPQAAATYQRNDAAMWAGIWNTIGRPTINDIMNRQAAAGHASGAAPTGAGSYIGDEAVYLGSSAVDGFAMNPVTSSVFDFASDLGRVGGYDGL